MSIDPITLSVVVKGDPGRAFALFAGDIGAWWPKGRTVGSSPHVDIVIEKHAGGRWFERAADGTEIEWGKVLAWQPPHRLLLAWQLDAGFRYDPNLVTEVELSFAAADAGTLVTVQHRKLERFGGNAERIAGQLGGGWPGMLASYAAHSGLTYPKPETMH